MSNFQEGSSRVNFPSGSDFTSSGTTFTAPYVIVKLSSGKVVKSSAATDKHIGVLYNCPDASGTADVLSINAQGTAKVTAGGSISVGNYITSDSNGKAVATTNSGDLVIGIAVEAAASGQVFAYQPIFIKYA